MHIISSPWELKIGRVYSEDDFNQSVTLTLFGNHKEYRFMVLRKATYEEYVKDVVNDGYSSINLSPPDNFFYQISMD